MKNKEYKKNYLVLDWSIESLEDRCEYLEGSGILQDLSEKRKSKLAKAQLNMIATYLFRSKDVKSGRKVDESYYIDDSSYLRSLKINAYIEDIDDLEEDEDSDNNNYPDIRSDDSINGDKAEESKDLELDDEHNVVDRNNYTHHIEDDEDIYDERLEHIEKLFNPNNIDHTILRRIVTTYRNIHDTEMDSDVVKSKVEHIMESILLCVDGKDDSQVIELLMQNMTEREISNVMNVSQQSVNKRIKKIFRKTIKLLNN